MSPGAAAPKLAFALIVSVMTCLASCVDLTRPGGATANDSDALGQPAQDAAPAIDRRFEAQPPVGLPLDADPSPLLDADPNPTVDAGAPDRSVTPPVMTSDAGAADAPPVAVDVPVVDAPVEATAPIDTRPPGLARGVTCTIDQACADGHCVDGVCCASACTDACHACNLPGSAGTCTAEPVNTLCAPASCGSGVSLSESRCTAAGQCAGAFATTCGAYACNGNFCASACLSNADCAAPYTCAGNACTSPGLLLYWTLDEPSGNTFQDSSGNDRTGTGIGSNSRPQPSTNVAPLKFPNPRSRDFSADDDQGVVASPVPPVVKLGINPELTFAAWFRATAVQVDGSSIVTFGGDYNLRIKIDKVEFLKRKGTTAGLIYGFAAGPATPIDGLWHHLAGTSGAAGMKVFMDGIELGTAGNNQPPLLMGPDQIGVGHQPSSDAHEHTGQIDDVRIYGRVLSAAEIANLARGNR